MAHFQEHLLFLTHLLVVIQDGDAAKEYLKLQTHSQTLEQVNTMSHLPL